MRKLLSPYNSIIPKQSLGQNFLIDENVARKIVRQINPKPTDILIEIGSGRGALTKHLIGKVKHLIAFEIDRRIVGELKEKYELDSVSIVHEDFLKTSISEWCKKYKSNVRIIGNIPYHLTSPILFKVFDEREYVVDLIIMVQREVARRIFAKPNTKDYGILSVFSQFYGNPEYMFDVTPNCFYPKPKVTSTLIKIKLHNKIHSEINEQLFKVIVKTAFGKRRKMLRNSLKYLPYDEEIIQDIFKNVDFNFEIRPEQITIDKFILLTKQIEKVLR